MKEKDEPVAQARSDFVATRDPGSELTTGKTLSQKKGGESY